MTNSPINKLKNLEDKLSFLTLTYISIIDNSIRQIAEDRRFGYNKNAVIKNDIFGTDNFVKFFLENEINSQKINFFKELKKQLFFPIDKNKTLNDALKNQDDNNFYLIYAHIYALRQKCIHGKIDKITNTNFGNLLEIILNNAEKNNQNIYQSTAIHYKYLFLLMPNSFCNELINLLFNIYERDIENQSPHNLKKIFDNNEIAEKEFTKYWQINDDKIAKYSQENDQNKKIIFAQKSFYREQLILKKSKLNFDDCEIFSEFKNHNLIFFGSKKVGKNHHSHRLEPRKIISLHKKNNNGENIFKSHQNKDKIYNNYRDFKFIGSDNLSQLFCEFSVKNSLPNNCLVETIINDYSHQRQRNRPKIQFTKKNSSLKNLALPHTKLSFEEAVHIYKFLANLNSLFRQHFTNIYNYWKDKKDDTVKKIKKFNQLKIDNNFIKNLEKIIDENNKNPRNDLKKIIFDELSTMVEQKFNQISQKKNPNQNEKNIIQNLNNKKTEINNKINSLNNPSEAIAKLRNNIDHSNLLGIFQDGDKKDFSLQNFNKNLSIVKKFLDKNPPTDDEKIPYSNFATFKNHLKQLFEKQDQQKFIIIDKDSNNKTNNVIIKNAVLSRKNKRKEFKKNIAKQLENIKNTENLSIIKFCYYDRFKAILRDELMNNFTINKKKPKKDFKKILI